MGAQESKAQENNQDHIVKVKQKDVKLIKDSRLTLKQIKTLREVIKDEKDWQVVYSTEKQGKNWTFFLDHLLLSEKSLVVVKDMDDYVFGVYVDQGLQINPKFHGSNGNFLFSLEPKIEIYHSTGLNNNYQYLNTGQKFLPNGIGFGGQMEYFGLFLNTDLCGRCDAEPRSTTYNNPVLSCKKEFTVKSIEIISILKKESENEIHDSILNNEEDAAFLEISGKTLYTHTYSANQNVQD